MKHLQSRLLGNFSEILHTFTTRRGGSSLPPYTGNNIAFHVGDTERSVLHNHQGLARELGYEPERLVHMRQIHSDRVVVVDESFDFHTPPECDALISNSRGIPLMVMVADCTPILLYDPVQRVIAVIHAGRAGAFNNIVAKTIHAMQETFATRCADITAVLGPSICSTCYKVNETIRDEAAERSLSYAMKNEQGEWYLDVAAILKRQLQDAGVPSANIEHIARCSSCENGLFFSYRADGGQTGRMAGVIMLRT